MHGVPGLRCGPASTVQGIDQAGTIPHDLVETDGDSGILAHTSSITSSDVYFRVQLSGEAFKAFEWSVDKVTWFPTSSGREAEPDNDTLLTLPLDPVSYTHLTLPTILLV